MMGWLGNMRKYRMKTAIISGLLAVLVLALAIAACGGTETVVETVVVERVITQAPVAAVEKIVTVEVGKEVQVPVEVEVTREVTVEVVREVTVEVVREVTVEVVREVTVEVVREVMVEVVREVTVEVTRERAVIKNDTTPPTPAASVAKPTPTPTTSDTQECQQYIEDIREYMVFIAKRYQAIGQNAEMLANGEISASAAEVRNRSAYNEIYNESSERNLNRYVPPDSLKDLHILVTNVSAVNIRLINSILGGDSDKVITDRARTVSAGLQELNTALANPPNCR